LEEAFPIYQGTDNAGCGVLDRVSLAEGFPHSSLDMLDRETLLERKQAADVLGNGGEKRICGDGHAVMERQVLAGRQGPD
jgi:hypothetical protein